jgi:multidrug efflux system outer membrane protein
MRNVMKIVALLLSLATLYGTRANAETITLREIQPKDHWERGDWWRVYRDPVLDALMQKAGRANQQLRIAVLQFDQARALARVARSEFFPQANAGFIPTHQSYSGNTVVPFDPNGTIFRGRNFEVPLDMSYELDLWGRVRLGHQAARQDAEQAANLIPHVLLSVHAELAQNYFRLRALDAQIRESETSLALLQETDEMTRIREKAGTATELETAQSATQVAAQKGTIAGLRAQRKSLENAIGVLVNQQAPSFTLTPLKEMPKVPVLPQKIPSDLLERRPDVASSERALAASLSRLGIAQRAAYPSISLIANGGFASGDLNNLFSTGSQKWVIGPRLSFPVISGGRFRANLESQKAEADIALARYRQAVLTAFAEVDTQLDAVTQLAEQMNWQQQAIAQANKAYQLAKLRYESGSGAYQDLLDTQQQLIALRNGEHQLLGQQLIASTTLIKAIGGSWHPSKSPVVPVLENDPQSQTQRAEPKKRSLIRRLFSGSSS